MRGDPETGTKNWELRRVPLIPDARALFRRMRNERVEEPPNAKVFLVRESQKALDRECNECWSVIAAPHFVQVAMVAAAGIGLTSSSSAAPSEGAGGYLLQYFNHDYGRKQTG